MDVDTAGSTHWHRLAFTQANLLGDFFGHCHKIGPSVGYKPDTLAVDSTEADEISVTVLLKYMLDSAIGYFQRGLWRICLHLWEHGIRRFW